MAYPPRRYQMGDPVQLNDSKITGWRIEDFYDGARREGMVGCDGIGPIYYISAPHSLDQPLWPKSAGYGQWAHESQISPAPQL